VLPLSAVVANLCEASFTSWGDVLWIHGFLGYAVESFHQLDFCADEDVTVIRSESRCV